MKNLKSLIRTDYKKISITLDEILKQITSAKQSNASDIYEAASSEVDYLKNFQFPINTVRDVELLEDAITHNLGLRNQIIEFLSRVGGRSGEGDGTKIGYKIIDVLFKPDLLINYTWTGISKVKNAENKIAFQSYSSIVDILAEVMHLSDSRYSKQKTINFLKDCILKHAKKRCQRKGKGSLAAKTDTANTNKQTDSQETTGVVQREIQESQLLSVNEEINSFVNNQLIVVKEELGESSV